jgi:hypothetical protein
VPTERLEQYGEVSISSDWDGSFYVCGLKTCKGELFNGTGISPEDCVICIEGQIRSRVYAQVNLLTRMKAGEQ